MGNMRWTGRGHIECALPFCCLEPTLAIDEFQILIKLGWGGRTSAHKSGQLARRPRAEWAGRNKWRAITLSAGSRRRWEQTSQRSDCGRGATEAAYSRLDSNGDLTPFEGECESALAHSNRQPCCSAVFCLKLKTNALPLVAGR